MGRHPRAEQAAAQMVAVDVLRHHRVGDRLLAADAGLAARLRATPRGCSAIASARRVAEQLASGEGRQGGVSRRRSPQAISRRSTTIPSCCSFALAGGEAAFGDNCAPCHGRGAQGAFGYPESSRRFLAVGRRHARRHPADDPARHPRGRSRDAQPGAQMPAFGRSGVLNEPQIADVAEYALSLSGHADDKEADERGAKIFAATCTPCHGARRQGQPERSERQI